MLNKVQLKWLEENKDLIDDFNVDLIWESMSNYRTNDSITRPLSFEDKRELVVLISFASGGLANFTLKIVNKGPSRADYKKEAGYMIWRIWLQTTIPVKTYDRKKGFQISKDLMGVRGTCGIDYFKKAFGKSLIDTLKSECRGDVEVLSALAPAILTAINKHCPQGKGEVTINLANI